MATNLNEAVRYASRIKMEIKGLTDYEAIVATLKGIKELYTKYKKELSKKNWTSWRKNNKDMINWYVQNFEAYKLGDPELDKADIIKPVTEKKPVTVLKKNGEKKADEGKKAETKKEPEKKKKIEYTEFGHLSTSMSGYIDVSIMKGAKRTTVVDHLVKSFGRTKGKAEHKVSAHIRHLQNDRGVTVVLTEDGKFSYKKVASA